MSRHSSGGLEMRRKGELSPAAIDRGWPHQIVLPARRCEGGGYEEIHEFCKNLTLCSRGHAVFHDREWPPEEIAAFRRQFGEVLEGLNRTLVVFIDNLDRCLPENAIHTLEAVRLFLFMPNTAFVIG